MGVITVRGKQLAVAIATQPANGAHATGTSNLTAIAPWLVAHGDVTARRHTLVDAATLAQSRT